MQVVAEAVAGAAHVADHVTLRDTLPGADREGRLVGVASLQAATVVEAGEIAVTTAFGFRLEQDHGTRGSGADRRARRHRDVDSLVHASPAHAKTGDDGPIDRPDELTGAVANRARGQGG